MSVIYRDMPAVWDPGFRPQFYARWGRESAVISARARRVAYPDFTQLLSIKAMFHGTEHYFVDGRRLAVDEDSFLILNAGRRYASRIEQIEPAHSFSVFFAPHLAEQALHALTHSDEALLDDPGREASAAPEFDERVRLHDDSLKPLLERIRKRVDAGWGDELWLEEQLQELLRVMLALERAQRRQVELIPSARKGTRRELYRRVGLATDFIHGNFRAKISLRDMADAAHLSPFHFLRLFKAVHRLSPSAYLNRRRVLAAKQLIGQGRFTLIEVADMVGFGSRTSLFRHLRAGSRRARTAQDVNA
jgi:AraC family transcriptional regulator